MRFKNISLFSGLAASIIISGQAAFGQNNWNLWSPQQSPQIAVATDATDGERDAAQELAKFIAQSSGKQPVVVTQDQARKTGVIYVGKASQVAQHPPAKWPAEARLKEESYRIVSNAADQTLTIEAGGPMAMKYAVTDFLQRYGGVRWYLPTDLFEVVPKRQTLALPGFDWLETPKFAPRTFSYIEQGPRYSYTGEQDPQFKHDRWALRNKLSVDGRLHYGFNHNLFRIVVPSRDYDAHPEWFPLINGKRFRPPTDDFQDWQPELTNDAVVEKAIQAGRDFFNNSSRWWEWYSLSINDGYGWSQSEASQKINGAPRYFRGRKVESNVYYDFVNKVASALYKEFPDRQIGLIAYYSVEAIPTNIDKLPPNVNVVITQEAAQHFDSAYKEQDRQLVQDWARVANGNVYRYEYSTLGWVVPRYYPALLADDAREMKRLGLKGYFTEDVPMWANNAGPLHWLTTQLWWDPEQDHKKLVQQFCDDLFGLASPAMQQYFGVWEKAWMRQQSGSFFAGLFNVPQQVALYTEQDRLEMQRYMQQAQALANEGLPKERVEFFAKGWKLINFYLEENTLANQLDQGTPRESFNAAFKLLRLLDEDAAWMEGFWKEPPLLNATYRLSYGPDGFKRGRWPDVMRARAQAALLAAITTQAQGDAGKQAQLLEETKQQLAGTTASSLVPLLTDWLSRPQPANSVRNASFLKGSLAVPEFRVGEPDEWSYWVNARGVFSYAQDRARLTDTNEGVIIQDFPAKAGDVVLAQIQYRTNPGAATPVVLSCRWVNEKGWFPSHTDGQEGIHDLIVSASPSSEWRTMSVLGRVPEGATGVKFMFGVSGQAEGDWIEFRQPYFGHH